jgi:hypothetical protein
MRMQRRTFVLASGAGVASVLLPELVLGQDAPATTAAPAPAPILPQNAQQAIGWALVPLETEAHFKAWDDVWERLPKEKERWLAQFSAAMDQLEPAQRTDLPSLENIVARLLDGGEGADFRAFMDRTYRGVSSNRTLLAIVYIDGVYETGVADPYILAKWDLPS